jgi:hypothetical protein
MDSRRRALEHLNIGIEEQWGYSLCLNNSKDMSSVGYVEEVINSALEGPTAFQEQ